jgi:hypothetical protein
VQLLCQLDNLGFGNRTRINERRAEHQLALLESLRLQDRVAAEVAQAHAQGQEAAARVKEAEAGLKEAIDSVNQNFEGLKQTKCAGANLLIVVIRPRWERRFKSSLTPTPITTPPSATTIGRNFDCIAPWGSRRRRSSMAA